MQTIQYDQKFMEKCNELTGIAKTSMDKHLFDFALKILDNLKELIESAGKLEYPHIQLKVLNLLAACNRQIGRPQKAVELLKSSLEISKQAGGSTGETLLTLGAVYIDLKNYQQARLVSITAAKEFQTLLNSSQDAQMARMMASAYYNAGNCDIALKDSVAAVNSYGLALGALRKVVTSKDDTLLRLINKAYNSALKSARQVRNKGEGGNPSAGSYMFIFRLYCKSKQQE